MMLLQEFRILLVILSSTIALHKLNTVARLVSCFAEDDPQLGEEDKALVRFKAQRVRDAKKKAGKFALGDDHHADADDSSAGLSLTHMGRSLSELQDLSQRPDELADLDDDLLEQMVAQYNFGGGGDDGGDAAAAAAATGEGRAGDGAPRTRKQVGTLMHSIFVAT